MDVLWAPWRMEYIGSEKSTGCVFCELSASRQHDPDDLVLWRGTDVYCVLNRYPYNPGHILVVINAHTDQLESLPASAQQELIWTFGKAMAIVQSVLKPEGINGGLNVGRAAGAGVLNHLHFHIVPRWSGDSNFLPVLGATKSMPEYLADTYAKLAPAFAVLQPEG